MKQSIKYIGNHGQEGNCLTLHFDNNRIIAATVDFGDKMSKAVFGDEGRFIITNES